MIAPDAPCLFCPELASPADTSSSSPAPQEEELAGEDDWDGGEEGILDFSPFVNQVSPPTRLYPL